MGVVRPVSDGFGAGTTRFLLRWADPVADERVEFIGGLSGTLYGDEVEGGDTDAGITAAYRKRILTDLAVDLSGRGNWFRRDEEPGGDPIFDQDLYTVDLRLGWAISPPWVVTAGGRMDWSRFPGRTVDPDSEEKETQRQSGASLAAARSLGDRGFVSAEVQVRHVRSNSESAEYGGPVAMVRTRVGLPFRMVASPLLVYGHRSFAHAPDADSTGTRRDDVWQVAMVLGRPVSSRAGVFLDLSYLRQFSNVDDFAYEQTRIAAGVSVDLVSSRPDMRLLVRARKAEYAPVVGADGVRFRVKAPGAGSVGVVGGWNGWVPEAGLLEDPEGDGVWEATFRLSPGIWRYAFVIDGVWVEPPDAPRVEDDGFGGRHGVLEVP